MVRDRERGRGRGLCSVMGASEWRGAMGCAWRNLRGDRAGILRGDLHGIERGLHGEGVDRKYAVNFARRLRGDRARGALCG